MFSVIYAQFHLQVIYAECHYAECRYAECHLQVLYAECRYAGWHSAFLKGSQISHTRVTNDFDFDIL